MTKQELLDRIEAIRDGLQDSDGMGRWGVDGACDDMSELMDDIEKQEIKQIGEIKDGLDIYNKSMYNGVMLDKLWIGVIQK